LFFSKNHARAVVAGWIGDFNTAQPHSAIGYMRRNLITADLPERAPAFFFVDIQPDQLPGFVQIVDDTPGVEGIETAPMLRGIISRINGRPAREVAPGHWAVRGDRGITYAAAPPEGTKILAGEWWPEDYDGPPLVSFAAEEAAEIGLELGDKLTLNVLGRITTVRPWSASPRRRRRRSGSSSATS
ncbi:hypothetical protein CNY89_20320, partial [Amaricoccus sp. HAR-UPW-R2A-40]